MNDELKKEISKAIGTLLQNIKSDTRGDEAMRLTQAALNCAHTAQVLSSQPNKVQ